MARKTRRGKIASELDMVAWFRGFNTRSLALDALYDARRFRLMDAGMHPVDADNDAAAFTFALRKRVDPHLWPACYH